MKSIKQLAAVVLGTLILSSAGAYAADHHCAKGTHWDSKTSTCVKTEKKN